MAQGKKSFIAYSDWKATFDELPDEDAGKLIKHIFAYVNDENPESNSILIKAVFANIKTTLKRDLQKWDKQLSQRSEAGRASAEKRKATKSNDRSTTVKNRARKSTDSVSVNASVNAIDNDILKSKIFEFIKFRSEIKKPILSTSTIEKIIGQSKNHSIEVFCKMIDNSIANGWQGIFELKENDKKTDYNQPVKVVF